MNFNDITFNIFNDFGQVRPNRSTILDSKIKIVEPRLRIVEPRFRILELRFRIVDLWFNENLPDIKEL